MALKPSAPLYDLRGLCKAYLGRFADAVADFNKAIETAGGRAPGPVFSNRGWAYLELGQPRKAISDLDRGIELSPDYTKAYENRAMAHAALKEWDLAIQDYTAAIQAAAVRRGNIASGLRQSATPETRRAPGKTTVVPLFCRRRAATGNSPG